MKEQSADLKGHDYTGLPKVPPNELWILPLGGVGRIGLNWTLYGCGNDWILVDAGIGFPEEGQAGEILLPHPAWVQSISRRIKALVVTHAHEDHIGAIQHLWPASIRCPIWATPYCAGILKERLKEGGNLSKVQINRFEPGVPWKVGGFEFDAVSVTHSTPQAVALDIKAAGRRILHTGDWKDDPTPLIGPTTDWPSMRRIGSEGVDVLVCDSTNAESENGVTSESDVLEGFRHVMASRQGLVVVACFGSNVVRVSSATRAAEEAGRRAAIIGRSMRTSEGVARGLGMLEQVPELLAHPQELRALERNQMALVCTGSQGEENAALWRMARNEVAFPKLEHGDTVIMSARAIPGREEGVGDLIKALEAKGVEVLTAKSILEGGLRLHVTGHACKNEIGAMHEALNPSFVMPVHGNPAHLEAHGVIATTGGRQFIIPSEGDIMRLDANGLSKVGRHPARIMIFDRDAIQHRRAPRRGLPSMAALTAPVSILLPSKPSTKAVGKAVLNATGVDKPSASTLRNRLRNQRRRALVRECRKGRSSEHSSAVVA